MVFGTALGVAGSFLPVWKASCAAHVAHPLSLDLQPAACLRHPGVLHWEIVLQTRPEP